MILTDIIRFGHMHNNDTNLFSFSIDRDQILEGLLQKATSPGKISLLDTEPLPRGSNSHGSFSGIALGKGAS